jgi:hypothetical protein
MALAHHEPHNMFQAVFCRVSWRLVVAAYQLPRAVLCGNTQFDWKIVKPQENKID